MEVLRRCYEFLRTVQVCISQNMIFDVAPHGTPAKDIDAYFEVFRWGDHRDVVLYLRGRGSFLLDGVLLWYAEKAEEHAAYGDYPAVTKEEVLWGLRVFAQVPSLMTLENCNILWPHLSRRTATRGGEFQNHIFTKWCKKWSTHQGQDGDDAPGQIMSFLLRLEEMVLAPLFHHLEQLAQDFAPEDEDSDMIDLTSEEEEEEEMIDLTDEE